MRTHLMMFGLMCLAAIGCGSVGQSSRSSDDPAQAAKPEQPGIAPHSDTNPAPNPMANFGRLIGGEWKRTFANGTSIVETWDWGPGKHSIRGMTEGEGASGQPWHEVRVFYWHPGRKEVSSLGISPFARGISHGTIKFQGDTAAGTSDLYQVRYGKNDATVRRSMGLRWTFDGPDKYHDVLLEDGGKGFEVLVEWDHIRSQSPAIKPPLKSEGKSQTRGPVALPKPSERLQSVASLIGQTWESKEFVIDGKYRQAGPLRVKTSLEWVPYADMVYVRTSEIDAHEFAAHLLDGYIYHNTGQETRPNILRCLILTRDGGVYEGDLELLDGGSLDLKLEGYVDDRVEHLYVRLDAEKDGTRRHTVWSPAGSQTSLPILDVEHTKKR